MEFQAKLYLAVYAVLFVCALTVVISVESKEPISYGNAFGAYSSTHKQIVKALRDSGFGFSSSSDSAAKIEEVKKRAEILNAQCKKDPRLQCLVQFQYPPNSKPRAKPSGVHAVDLDELDRRYRDVMQMYNYYRFHFPIVNPTKNQEATITTDEQELKEKMRKEQELLEKMRKGLQSPTTIDEQKLSEEMRTGFGRGPVGEAYCKMLKDAGLDHEGICKHFGEIRSTLANIGLGYDPRKAESFGQAYISDVVKRKKLIRQHCPYGNVGLTEDSCRLPLYAPKHPVRPANGPHMFDLKVLEKRHNEITEWIKNTNNQVAVTDAMSMHGSYYNLKGEPGDLPYRKSSNAADYLSTKHKSTIIRGASKPEIDKYVDRATSMSGTGSDAGKVVQANYLDAYEDGQIRDLRTAPEYDGPTDLGNTEASGILTRGNAEDYIAASVENRGYGEIRHPKREHVMPSFGGYLHTKGLPGGNLKVLQKKSDLIKKNCTRGRPGFESGEPCLYPIHKEERPPLPESNWNFPITDNSYPFDRKP